MSPLIKRSSASSKSSRLTLAEIFSSLDNDNPDCSADNLDGSLSSSNPMIAPDLDSSNFLDVSQQLDISPFPPPGLHLGVNPPIFSLNSSADEHSRLLSDDGNNYSSQMTSTPYQPKDLKGKEKAIESQRVTVPKVTIFRAKGKSPKFSLPFHERSQSVSLGQTVFYSMSNSRTKIDESSTSPDITSSTEHTGKPVSSESQQSPPTSLFAKTQSMSDTFFPTVLRSSSSQSRESEIGIKDESTKGIVFNSRSTSGPDHISARANTCHILKTPISPAAPEDTLKHLRKTSKEESLIISLQTQQTELCGHHEADLKARDNLIGILGKKLSDLEEDDTKHKNVLRSWKKKVQELERVCRQLEETVEDSRQESMERSIIDEASGEALCMLHHQIASLEREKIEWSKREQGLREEIETFKCLVKDKAAGQTGASDADITAEHDALKADFDELETRTSAMEVERNESEAKKKQFETELREVQNLKDALEKERDELKDAFQRTQEQAAELGRDLQERDNRVSELEQERQFTNDNVTRLEANLCARDVEITQIAQRVLERDSEVGNLHEEMSTLNREHAHLINERTRALRDAARLEDESKARMDQLLREKAEANVEIKTSRDRIILLNEEVERLRRYVQSLQQESADKDDKIVQMTKQHSLDKENPQGVNVVLDSRQRELELLKGNGVKGTAGSTPPKPSKAAHRRNSSIFTSIPVRSRPPSMLSESGADATHIPKKERTISSEMAPPPTKIVTLGKSSRVNGSGPSSVSSSANRSVHSLVNGSMMGPPPLKSRPSIVSPPTPPAKGLSIPRASSVRPTLHSRVSSVNLDHKLKNKISRTAVYASSVSEHGEKENVDTASSRRRSMIPTLA